MDNGYELKEILNETRVDVRKNEASFLGLKEKYDNQSTRLHEKVKELKEDLNGLGEKVTRIDLRLRSVEMRVYAAMAFVSAALVAFNYFIK